VTTDYYRAVLFLWLDDGCGGPLAGPKVAAGDHEVDNGERWSWIDLSCSLTYYYSCVYITSSRRPSFYHSTPPNHDITPATIHRHPSNSYPLPTQVKINTDLNINHSHNQKPSWTQPPRTSALPPTPADPYVHLCAPPPPLHPLTRNPTNQTHSPARCSTRSPQ
jgi:hypothetical protein